MKHVVKPVVDNVVKPVVDNVVKPVVDNVVKPVVDNVIKPVAQPIMGALGLGGPPQMSPEELRLQEENERFMRDLHHQGLGLASGLPGFPDWQLPPPINPLAALDGLPGMIGGMNPLGAMGGLPGMIGGMNPLGAMGGLPGMIGGMNPLGALGGLPGMIGGMNPLNAMNPLGGLLGTGAALGANMLQGPLNLVDQIADRVVDKLQGRPRFGGSQELQALGSKIDELINLLKSLVNDRKDGTQNASNQNAGNAGDKSIDDANKFYDDTASKGTGDKVEDLKKLIQKLIDMGILTPEQGEKLMQALDKGLAADKVQDAVNDVLGGKSGEGSFGNQVDTMGSQLGKLSQLADQAKEVKGEIDGMVSNGKLSAEAGDQAKADIDRAMADATKAVLDKGSSNDIHGTKISDDQILGSVGDKLGKMDANLNKLGESDSKADAARDKVKSQADSGAISQEEADKRTSAINDRQAATELAVLKW
ncbi:MAG: hypothetical protein MUE98_00935 [Rhodobacteraceae bacterium]|nr:hypothetical protein [Paracoccaceae bacterium]